jgi:hypothetical protein
MDTEWFAIDAKGQVALFDTDEAGCMPIHAHTLELTHLYLWGFIEELGPADHDNILWHSEGDPLEQLTPLTLNLEQLHVRLHAHMHSAHAQDPIPSLLCVMRDQDAARRLIREARPDGATRALGLIRRPYPAILAPELLVTPLLDAIERGDVLGGDSIRDYANENFTALLGVHVYEYPSYSRVPYQRAGAPRSPLTIERLPEPLRARLLQLRLDADFSQDEQVDPEDSFECERW